MLNFNLNPKTEILATTGPTLHTIEQICKAFNKEVYNFRLALSFRDRDVVEYVYNIRSVEKDKKIKAEVLLDFPASRPRTCEMEPIYMNVGEKYTFECNDNSSLLNKSYKISNFSDAVEVLQIGERMFFRDGKIQLKVIEIDKASRRVIAVCILASADLRSNCSCVFPDTNMLYEPIIDLDRVALKRLQENNLYPNWFAVSFASGKEQIDKMKQLATEYFPEKKIKIMAKIETEQGVRNIEEILDNVDGIMIGRGDLGLHISAVTLPKIQEYLVDFSRKKAKVCVIATEYLEIFATTGIINRAELSDIALGTRQKATALMLSMESANSKFPMESLELMRQVIKDNN